MPKISAPHRHDQVCQHARKVHVFRYVQVNYEHIPHNYVAVINLHIIILLHCIYLIWIPVFT